MRNTPVIKEKVQIAHDILIYLSKHPDAQDTLEGIVEWWLLEQVITHHMAAVKEALAELVDRELVLEIKSADSRVRYRSNGEKYREIKAMVDEKNRITAKRKSGDKNRGIMARGPSRGKAPGKTKKQLLENNQNQP
ncbi:MAG: hypothetical protein A4E58_03208 [Syntrophorhabdus sp. PtaB.Bin006]|nr:MAG: hypothetical protein A4E58_03208 [Syntrophorhabdus sp. PtaB.Bin006]